MSILRYAFYLKVNAVKYAVIWCNIHRVIRVRLNFTPQSNKAGAFIIFISQIVNDLEAAFTQNK